MLLIKDINLCPYETATYVKYASWFFVTKKIVLDLFPAKSLFAVNNIAIK